MKTSILLSLGILVAAPLFAQTNSFEQTKPLYRQLKVQYDQDRQAIQEGYEKKISVPQKKIAQSEERLEKCTNYQCREDIKAEIRTLELEIRAFENEMAIHIGGKARIFVSAAQELAVGAFAFETLQLARADSSIEDLTVDEFTGCRRGFVERSIVSPTRDMTCIQLNVQFKLANKYYKASAAIGLLKSWLSISGVDKGIYTDDEIKSIDDMFKRTTRQFMSGVGAKNVIFGKSVRGRPNNSESKGFVEGKPLYYRMTSREFIGYFNILADSN